MGQKNFRGGGQGWGNIFLYQRIVWKTSTFQPLLPQKLLKLPPNEVKNRNRTDERSEPRNILEYECSKLIFCPATVNQNNGPQITIDVSQNPSIGNTILTDAQEADLLAGLWYVNVHSTTFGPGEIRGQVLAANPVPVPAAAWLLASGILGLASFRRR